VWVLLGAAALLRAGLVERQGLWPDEVFSLAVATGHSLEHPAAAARPELGDWVEPPGPVRAAELRPYLEHGSDHSPGAHQPAGLGRVLRAVALSDTSPPLYYLLLWAWTRIFGTGDAPLRLFSVLWAVAALPLVAALARRVAGPAAVVPALLLAAFAPAALYYAAEARMYSLLWFLACVLAWETLELGEDGQRRLRSWFLLGWTLTAAAGLLTHYFFAFVVAACAGWLLVRPGGLPGSARAALLAAGAAAGLLVLPWYLGVPESLAQWRVTAGWQDGFPPRREALLAPLRLFWFHLSGAGHWGWPPWTGRPAIAAWLLVGVAALASRRARAALLAPPSLLLWAWSLAACLGPTLFDLLLDTRSALVTRYALAGLPATLLLAAVALAALRPAVRAGLLALVLLAWLPGIWDVANSGFKMRIPSRQIAARLDAWAQPGDLVILHSIPSGELAVARYMKSDIPVLPWTDALGVRRVAELPALLAGRRRVALLTIHLVGQAVPEEEWLRRRARLDKEEPQQSGRILYFDLTAPPAPPEAASAAGRSGDRR
jgi:Dolichyl-phosphate-mannose-protein mannosyltransferase